MMMFESEAAVAGQDSPLYSAFRLVPDSLWREVEPLLPPSRCSSQGGRPRFNDRKALAGILFVRLSGIRWDSLPVHLGCGSGMTCWRRWHAWQEAGVWNDIYRICLNHLS